MPISREEFVKAKKDVENLIMHLLEKGEGFAFTEREIVEKIKELGAERPDEKLSAEVELRLETLKSAGKIDWVVGGRETYYTIKKEKSGIQSEIGE